MCKIKYVGIALLVFCNGIGQSASPPTLTSQEAISTALSQHKAGQTTAGIKTLKNYLKSATPKDALKPMLRLGYLEYAAGNKKDAAARFKRLALLPPGVDDAVRGEAALRTAFLSNGRERWIWAERIIAGQFEVDSQGKNDAYRLAAGAAHQQKDLRRAIELYHETDELKSTGSKRAYILKELAGLYFEVAKGEGKNPVVESSRPEMFRLTRSFCAEIAAMSGVPAIDLMVTELMVAETWLFENEFQQSYDATAAFLSKWENSEILKKSKNARIYLNTAKTLQMQNAYIIGKIEEAEAIAITFVENRPKSDEEFNNYDSLLISLEVLKLCAADRGDDEAVSTYGSQAWQHRADYLGTERTLQRRRASWVVRSKGD